MKKLIFLNIQPVHSMFKKWMLLIWSMNFRLTYPHHIQIIVLSLILKKWAKRLLKKIFDFSSAIIWYWGKKGSGGSLWHENGLHIVFRLEMLHHIIDGAKIGDSTLVQTHAASQIQRSGFIDLHQCCPKNVTQFHQLTNILSIRWRIACGWTNHKCQSAMVFRGKISRNVKRKWDEFTQNIPFNVCRFGQCEPKYWKSIETKSDYLWAVIQHSRFMVLNLTFVWSFRWSYAGIRINE